MELFLIRAFQLILSLSILVIVHEMGHYLFSRLFGVRVERFYMFFNPVFSIFRAKNIDGKIRFSWFSKKAPESFKAVPEKTEWGLGWIPLGGYCAISGMIDESMNTEQMKEPEKVWEFRSKKAGQRLLIMVGGVLFNFILALMIYSAVLNVWGEEYLPIENAPMGMEFSPVGHQAGFKDGDRLISADGVLLDRFNEKAMRRISAAKEITVWRDSQQVVVRMPQDFMQKLIEGEQGFAGFRFPTIIKEITKGSPCALAGLQSGDSLAAINAKATLTFPDFVEELGKHKNQKILLTYFREGLKKAVYITPDENGKLGFLPTAPEELYLTRVQKFSFLESIPAGINKGIGTLTGYASDMKYMFTKAGAKSLGGFGTLGRLFPADLDWQIFWTTTAFLSIILAFMNILPIPALDGGHILFLLYEIVARRKPSDKFMEYAQMVGMFLLIGLLVYANGNDLYRWLFK